VYLAWTDRLQKALARHIQQKYAVELPVVLEQPPEREMGEVASPVAFELAKRLKRAPRQIAQEIAKELSPVPGIARVEVAGAGYLNAYFDRLAFWDEAQSEISGGPRAAPEAARGRSGKDKIIVEHTSINPNKAAHIGHLRNAVLGDTVARTLRYADYNVQVQNYIDNTGVQLADVVVGLLEMEHRTPASVGMLAREPRFDYYCWDLYAKVTQFFAEDKDRATKLRGDALRAIEEGRGQEAQVAQVVENAIVGSHLRTMARLGISYDLLARESEILHLKFWDAAFAQLKKSGAIELATSGPLAGCWIMPWGEESKKQASENEEAQAKVIVRSNGTVTYVGKDIAYQLWKFGLLGKDFRYAKWPNAPEGQTVWATTNGTGDSEAPRFGEPAKTVYNVIDSRQAYLQDVVAEGLRRLGHENEAKNSVHFAYEIVALTPRCAAEMGYQLTPDEAKKPYVEVSGRRGLGVKADDLLDRLEEATLAEVRERHAHMPEPHQRETAHAIAVGALRFFLLKFTRNAIIAFDFKDALNFEGETGPYCQYAVVRIRGIRRKGREVQMVESALRRESVASLLNTTEGSGLWELALLAGSLDHAVDATIGAQEPAFAARYAFQLAQAFNNFYHRHHILSESDTQKRTFLLRLTELVERQLVKALSLMGIEAPEKM
jgi:arginyl-tRNA synthetase